MHRAEGAMQGFDGGSVSEGVDWTMGRWDKRKQEEKKTHRFIRVFSPSSLGQYPHPVSVM